MELVYEFILWDMGTYWIKKEIYPTGYSLFRFIMKENNGL
jgi:hypothetical protein